jgi:hypothetical protein
MDLSLYRLMDYDKPRRHNPATSNKRTRFDSDDGKRKWRNYSSMMGLFPLGQQKPFTGYLIFCPG